MTSDRFALLHSRDPGQCRRWSEWLAAVQFQTLTTRTLLGQTVEAAAQLSELLLVLTDEPVDLAQMGLSRSRLAQGEIGVIAIGCETRERQTSADVNLPADVTGREVGLACELLATIVLLRRELRQYERQQVHLREMAETDPLTDLPNRRAWEAALASLAETSGTGQNQDKVLAILDVDGFKRWNDELGHAQADVCLAQIAKALAGAIRRQDFVARWGGDEFALLLSGLTPSFASEVVERIRWAACLADPLAITLSAGWANVEFLDGRFDAATAFLAADAALRDAKQAGGDQSRSA